MQEAVEGDAEEQREKNFGYVVAGKEKDADGGESGEAGIESGAGVEGAKGPMIAEECEEKDTDCLREMRGKGVEAEETEAKGAQPVGERRFFEIADAVDTKRDKIAGEGHVTGGVGVGGVGVVEQRWREEGSEEDDEPEADENEQRGGASRVTGVERCLRFGDCFQ